MFIEVCCRSKTQAVTFFCNGLFVSCGVQLLASHPILLDKPTPTPNLKLDTFLNDAITPTCRYPNLLVTFLLNHYEVSIWVGEMSTPHLFTRRDKLQ